MTIAGKAVLVTGANRGIGRALVNEALGRGAGRVYAGTRQPFTHADARVTSLILDVTDAAQVEASAGEVTELDVLINNAGVAPYDDLSDPAALEQTLAVNLLGTYRVTRSFLPLTTSCAVPSSTTCRRWRSPRCRSPRPTRSRRRPRSP